MKKKRRWSRARILCIPTPRRRLRRRGKTLRRRGYPQRLEGHSQGRRFRLFSAVRHGRRLPPRQPQRPHQRRHHRSLQVASLKFRDTHHASKRLCALRRFCHIVSCHAVFSMSCVCGSSKCNKGIVNLYYVKKFLKPPFLIIIDML